MHAKFRRCRHPLAARVNAALTAFGTGRHCTTFASITLATIQCNAPLASALLPEMAQRFRATSSTMVRAATPTPGTAPVTGRYTRSERVHCLRIGCIAYVSGATPSLTSTTADQTLTHSDLNTTTVAPARAANINPHRTKAPSRRIEGVTPFEPNPHQTRAQTRKRTS